MIASSKKRVRLTPHQKVVEGLKSRISGLEETVAKNRAEISDLEDQAGDMLRERDRFCAALGIGNIGYFNGFSARPNTPSFTEVAVHCGRRFALADIAERFLKMEDVNRILDDSQANAERIRDVLREVQVSRKDS